MLKTRVQIDSKLRGSATKIICTRTASQLLIAQHAIKTMHRLGSKITFHFVFQVRSIIQTRHLFHAIVERRSSATASITAIKKCSSPITVIRNSLKTVCGLKGNKTGTRMNVKVT